MIVDHGLLLTPEIERWRDSKMAPSPAEDYVVVSHRCCFTELTEAELPKHMETFGGFALEFEQRTLCDLGAVPVFYIPRVGGTNYGVGPALVTQLAQVQEILTRVAVFRDFALQASAQAPDGPVVVAGNNDGGLEILVPGTAARLSIPRDVLTRAAAMNPSFKAPSIPPGQAAELGFTASALASVVNIMHWGLHESHHMVGAVKALGSLFYSTERPTDPFLSHYQQREWRIIGGVAKDGVAVTTKISAALRAQLVELDAEFFNRELDFPSGRKRLVDDCELFSAKPGGGSVLEHVRRVFCPCNLVAEVRAVVGTRSKFEVVGVDTSPAR